MQLLQDRLQTALKKLGLAKRLLNATQSTPTPQARYDYIPALLPHSHNSMLRHEYGLDASGVRFWFVLHASSKSERCLSDCEAVKQSLITAARIKSELWSQVSHTVFRNSPPTSPMWAHRFVILALDSICVWYHPKALCSTMHFSVHERWQRYNTIPAPPIVDYMSHDVTRMFPDCERQWVWSTSQVTPFSGFCCFNCIAGGEFQQVMWYLYTTRAALSATTSLQSLRVHALFKTRRKVGAAYGQLLIINNCFVMHTHVPSGLPTGTATYVDGLNYWSFVSHIFPTKKNPLPWMIRACSHIHQWSLATPVYGHMICVVFHVHLFCLYIGRTEGALITRLRKHWTTASSGSEDSPFYSLLCRTGIQDWTIAPLQWTDCETTACFLERAWWSKWQRWALNACAPAVPASHDAQTPPPQHTKRLQ